MSTTIAELKTEHQNRMSQLFKECSVFFAFSDDQFKKAAQPLPDGDVYVGIGAGGYLPKSKASAFTQGYKELAAWFEESKKAMCRDKKVRRQVILSALYNHECFYTNDIDDAMIELGTGFTRKEVAAVFRKQRKYADV